ncbi:HAD family hydrolase [Miltoncostaea marina]|uniref:HAD family hydrolase n=1 Tax=Miltoncostaea marina TaxID=2843215 RepID=UPI001C3CB6FB|nr:HAD-IA family hydrolase [Miltoncostaea marina]
MSDRVAGVIFDVDGVLVDSPHERAWREALRELMEGPWSDLRAHATWTPDAFTSRVYREELSGRPRMDGALAALRRFGVPGAEARAAEYADHKQAMVLRLIRAGEFTPFSDGLRFVRAVKAAGLRVAAASSSRNARLLLSSIPADGGPPGGGGASVAELFDADVSGRAFAHGKPHPDMFLAAAAELGVAPAEAVVVEDAPAGVVAAKAGGMTALGVARADDAPLLEAAGADLVVANLDLVDVDALDEGRVVARSG